MLPCRHPLHTWDLCGVASPNIHALNGWDCIDWPQVTWGLRTWKPMWTGPKYHTLWTSKSRTTSKDRESWDSRHKEPMPPPPLHQYEYNMLIGQGVLTCDFLGSNGLKVFRSYVQTMDQMKWRIYDCNPKQHETLVLLWEWVVGKFHNVSRKAYHKVCGCYWAPFHVLQLLLFRFTQVNSCCISTFVMKHL